jgi:hypothetical protein
METANILSATSTVINAGGVIWGDYSMIKGFTQLQDDEMNGRISHSDAERERAHMLTSAVLQHGLMLHGMLEPQGADRVGNDTPETQPPPAGGAARPGETSPGTPTQGARQPEGPPEIIPEAELERRAQESAKTGPQTPAASKDNVRARFSTPDNLHEIFILEDGRIFRCSLTCTELRGWYDPYLTRQKPGGRQDEALRLSERLAALEERATGGEKSADLDREIGRLDQELREFIVPDLQRELQHEFGRPETYLNQDQVRRLLAFFNVDEIIGFAGPEGLGSPQAARALVEALEGLEKFLTPADRAMLRPVLAGMSEGGPRAAEISDFLGRIARIHEVPGVTFDLADLIAAFENGDAILHHGPLQEGVFLEQLKDDDHPYEVEGGRLKIEGREGRLPKRFNSPPWSGGIDFVILRQGGNYRLVLGLEHSGLSRGASSVFGAGQLKVDENGFIIQINRRSGHYMPSEANLRRAAQFLIDKKILLDPVIAGSMGRPVVQVDPNF